VSSPSAFLCAIRVMKSADPTSKRDNSWVASTGSRTCISWSS
jgi:hypothetical protein